MQLTTINTVWRAIQPWKYESILTEMKNPHKKCIKRVLVITRKVYYVVLAFELSMFMIHRPNESHWLSTFFLLIKKSCQIQYDVSVLGHCRQNTDLTPPLYRERDLERLSSLFLRSSFWTRTGVIIAQRQFKREVRYRKRDGLIKECCAHSNAPKQTIVKLILVCNSFEHVFFELWYYVKDINFVCLG